MDTARKVKLMWRWSLLTAGVIALFWLVWYLIAGSVPSVTSLKMTEKWTLQLPFSISRWWDVLIGPIWSCIIVLIATSEKIRKNENMVVGLVVGLVYGLAVWLAYGLAVWLAVGLAVGLVVGLAYGLAVWLAYGLAVGLVVGLAYGLAVWLAYGLAVWLAVGLAVGLAFLLKCVFSRKLWSVCWTSTKDWLLAR